MLNARLHAIGALPDGPSHQPVHPEGQTIEVEPEQP
jgi:hypothetical protein